MKKIKYSFLISVGFVIVSCVSYLIPYYLLEYITPLLLKHFGFIFYYNIYNSLKYFTCIVVGLVVSIIYLKFIAKPLKDLEEGFREVKNGNFNVSVKESGLPILKNMIKTFNQMTEELKYNELLRKNFIETYSHEMKNPINSINGYAKLALKEDKNNSNINAIYTESEHLKKICSNTLLLCKIDGKKLIEKEETNVKNLLIDTIAEYLTLKDLDAFEYEVIGDITNKYVNKSLMKEAFINLLDNIYKYAKRNTTITIKFENNSITIINETSLDDRPLEYIKKHGYQIDSSSSGNGVGLSIVDRIANLHNGEFSAAVVNNKFIARIVFEK